MMHDNGIPPEENAPDEEVPESDPKEQAYLVPHENVYGDDEDLSWLPEVQALSPQHRRFVEIFLTGPDGIRGVICRSAHAAGFSGAQNVPRKSGSHLLEIPEIKQAIEAYHRESAARTIAKLKDWREMAPESQYYIKQISRGLVPSPTKRNHWRPMVDKDDAQIARVMLDAHLAILERAYPTKILAAFSMKDRDKELALLLGIDASQLPERTT